MKYKTVSIELDGGICGSLWMPAVSAGMPLTIDLWRERDRFSTHNTTIRDLLLHVLRERGGDFQGAEFTNDTVIVFHRSRYTGRGNYSRVDNHIKQWRVADLEPDLVDSEHETVDFMDCDLVE